jgi:plasmid replication initiation protein
MQLLRKNRPVQTRFTGKEIVVQANDLIQAPRTLGIQAQKLLLFLISKLNPDQTNNVIFRIPILELAKTLGTPDSNLSNLYRSVKKHVNQLMNHSFVVNRPIDGINTTTHFSIFGYVRYWDGKGYADVKLSDDILPYLISLKERFTQYKLSQITTLSSLHAMRMYEILKSRETIGSTTFLLDELKYMLNISPDTFKSFKDFRIYVLEIAKREINKKTDLIINYSFHKSGRKIVAVEFNIESKSKPNPPSQPEELQKKQTNIAKKLLKYGFSISETLDINKLYQPNRIECALKAVKQHIKQNRNVDIKAVVIRAIEEQWYPEHDQVISQPSEPVQNQSKKKKLFFSKIFNLFK